MNYAAARHNMVESQVKTNSIVHEKLLDALRKIPRESFVPSKFQGVAYVDNPVPLDDGRFLMAPLDMARLIQEAKPTVTDLALVIGCSTGYGAAVLSNMVGAVVGLESNASLASDATEIFEELCIDNVAVVAGDLSKGYPDQAPYDIIFFEGAIPNIPEQISSQLAEGGRLVCVLSDEGIDKAILCSLHSGNLSTRIIFESTLPMLPDFKKETNFVF
ncbi:MAG: protein-L-isoaspartate O-methyltransferase [Pseudomonadota bacterium]|nr:protein-L-isoaspartate O-methyltransferase [Pseudomonadota bacterium]